MRKALFSGLFILLTTGIISCSDGETVIPELSIGSASIIEGNEGITIIEVDITASTILETALEISYNTSDGLAKAGKDYNEVNNGTVTIPSGSDGITLEFEILTDEIMEFREDFILNITNTGDAKINTNKVSIYILDDDDETYVIEKDADGYITPNNYPEMSLVWSDEFDGSDINKDNWTFELGDGCPDICGWGNNELQSYTAEAENARIVDGKLIITAIEGGGDNYTSSRMITKDKQEFEFGRIDIRAKLPEGQGIWPAIWMLGENIDEVGWPRCGEIDIMELVGHLPKASHGTAHFNNGGHQYTGSSYVIANKFSEEFHVFSIFWDKDVIKWYVDYNKFFEITSIDVGSSYPFNNPFFFIMNIAVGGNWPGEPDETTVFPQEMQIDYVRVFQPE
jgi:hypothetical protein